MEAKQTFEAFSRSKGVKVLHYHAYNGISFERNWIEYVQKKDTHSVILKSMHTFRMEKLKTESETYTNESVILLYMPSATGHMPYIYIFGHIH